MARYLIQASYTSDSWAAQVDNPTNRFEAVKAMLAPAGINMLESYYSFGEFDLVIIAEGPDNVTTAAGLIKVASGGAIAKLQTTPLLTAEEGLEAITKAGSIGYTPAGS